MLIIPFRSITLALLLLSAASLGCSQSNSVQQVNVQGSVQLDGAPLADVVVRFYSPTGGGGGFNTSTEGKFKSQQPIKVGAYSIALVAPASSPGAEVPTTGPLAKIPAHIWSVKDSGLEATVTSDGPNEFSFEISSNDKPPAGFRAPRPSAKGPTLIAPVSTDS